MTAAPGADVGMQRPPHERQVADQIENLVPNAFVGPAKRVAHGTVGVEDQKVAVAHRDRQPRFPQPRGVVLRDKRAGRGEFRPIGVWRDADGERLPADRAGTVVQLVLHRETGESRRRDLDPRVVIANAAGLSDDERLNGRPERLAPGGVDRVNEGPRRAVEAGHLLRIDFD